MNRERHAIMEKARAKRLRRKGRGKNAPAAPRTGSLAESIKSLAESAVEKLSDLTGRAAQSVIGTDRPSAEPSTLPVR